MGTNRVAKEEKVDKIMTLKPRMVTDEDTLDEVLHSVMVHGYVACQTDP